MKDKIKRYARLLWKYKYLILWAGLVVMLCGKQWGAGAYPLVRDECFGQRFLAPCW